MNTANPETQEQRKLLAQYGVQDLRERYVHLREIDDGAHGIVYFGTRTDGETEAVKVFTSWKYFLNERRGLELFGKFDIAPKAKGAFFQRRGKAYQAVLCMELVDGQTLLQRKNESRDFTQREIRDIALATLELVGIIHENVQVHGDLKEDNVMVLGRKISADPDHYRIIDFSLCDESEAVEIDLHDLGDTLALLLKADDRRTTPLGRIFHTMCCSSVERGYHSVEQVIADIERVRVRG